MKTILQFVILILAFFGTWIALSSLPWNKWLQMDKLREKKEKKISDFFINAYGNDKQQYKNDKAVALVTVIKNKICLANGIDTSSIHIYVFKDTEINAFTIPGGNIIVNSGLIQFCDNPEMLAGVIGHEIGHIQNGHIMKRFAREIGLSAVLMIGGDNLSIIKEILRTLSSSSFDRSQEREADLSAVHYLQQAHIDACPMAGFFTKMNREKGSAPAALEWISTHPASAERAREIKSKCNEAHRIHQPLDVNWESTLVYIDSN